MNKLAQYADPVFGRMVATQSIDFELVVAKLANTGVIRPAQDLNNIANTKSLTHASNR